MKATIERDALRAALKITAPAVAKYTPNPALTGCLIEVNVADYVTITTTNLDRLIRHEARGHVDGSGDVVVPHGVLRRIVDACGAGAVTLSTSDDDDDLNIEDADGMTARVNTLVRAEWPDLVTLGDDATSLDVDDELRSILHRSLPAVSHDQSRPVLTGAWLHSTGLVAASDSYIGTHTPTDYELPDVTIPGDVLRDVLAVAGDALTMASDGKRVEFSSEGTTWRTMCIEGDRPDVSRLIPDKAMMVLTVERADLLDALGSVEAIHNDHAAVLISADADTITLSKSAQGVGEVVREIGCQSVDGLDDVIGMNPRNLTKVLEVVRGDEVELDFHGVTKPLRITDGDTTHIIMPVRMS